MLHKVQSLTSIGRFRTYQAAGPVTFGKVTLLYGDNGGGKTTLTSVIRSLTTNRPELIHKRKSTSATSPQSAQIVQRVAGIDTFHTFHHQRGWTTPFPGIEIFDVHFINDNIYSGFAFNEDQKRQLHQFVIGDQGVALTQQIEQNKEEKSACRVLQTSLEDQIIQTVAHSLTRPMIPAFQTATAVQGIDQEIAAAQSALATASANTAIRTFLPLTSFPGTGTPFDFASLEADLQMSSTVIQNETLKSLLDSHIRDLSQHGISSPEIWLQLGFAYVQQKAPGQQLEPINGIPCPLCQQPIDNSVEIIKAYAARFDAAFNSLVQRLQGHTTRLQSLNIDVILQGIKNNDVNNRTRISSWSQYLPATVQSPLWAPLDEEAIKAEYQTVVSLMETKRQNPSTAASIANVTTLKDRLAEIRTALTAYNVQANEYNAAITTFLSGIQTVDAAQQALEAHMRSKLRFIPAVATLCTQLATEKQRLTNLDSQYAQLMLQQQAAASAFFGRYSTRINYYLTTVFKTPFKIEDVTHVRPQGLATQSKLSYKLTINGQDISFNPDLPNSTKYCLSEGDKSTIALALFLAKLDIDPQVQQKIILFDDPLSSFDSNRRRYTVQILKSLVPNVKQLIVLSHNEFFLHDIYKGIAPADKIALRISTDFLADASFVEPLDIEKLVQNDYFKQIDELNTFLRNPDITKKDTILGWLRNVLEAHLRFKFFRQLSNLQANDQTFGKIIDELVRQGVVFRDNVNSAMIIQKLRLINGVSCKQHHGEPHPDFAALGIDPASMTVTELVGLIRDTLNLIDYEL